MGNFFTDVIQRDLSRGSPPCSPGIGIPTMSTIPTPMTITCCSRRPQECRCSSQELRGNVKWSWGGPRRPAAEPSLHATARVE